MRTYTGKWLCSFLSLLFTVFYASRSDSKEDEHQTYVEGITVGISLACVFLIVLFIAWCYTKHQAVGGGRSSSETRAPSSNTHKKGTYPIH